MIRTNLSTRPFYNARAVHLALALVAVVAVAASAFNASSLVRFSRSDTELALQATRDEAKAAELRAGAAAQRAGVNPRQMEAAFGQAREANDLIDRRTFSWTALLNQFETTLPDNARIVAIRPRVDKDRGIVLAVTVLAVDVTDLGRFMENLVATGEFTGLLSREEHPTESGQLQASIEAVYRPRPATAPVAAQEGR